MTWFCNCKTLSKRDASEVECEYCSDTREGFKKTYWEDAIVMQQFESIKNNIYLGELTKQELKDYNWTKEEWDAYRFKKSTESVIEGIKNDKEKPRLDLIPPEAIQALGKVLEFGSRKYTDRNWEKGMDFGRVFAALQRHLWSWWSGESVDPESGYSHLWHAFAGIAFLLTYEARKIGHDDRPKPERMESP